MSKKLNLIAIIIFSLIFTTGVFYKINKFERDEGIYAQASSISDDQENQKNSEEQSNYKSVTWNLQNLFKSDDALELKALKSEYFDDSLFRN